MADIIIKGLPRLGGNDSMTLDVSTYDGELLVQILFRKDMANRIFEAEWVEDDNG
jgi:hypothetical protein